MKKSLAVLGLSFILVIAWGWPALAQMPNAYGVSINLARLSGFGG